jgi:CarD family transcriptional regulator
MRDLYTPVVDPEQSYAKRQLYEAALDRLASELAIVQHITEAEAVAELEGLMV